LSTRVAAVNRTLGHLTRLPGVVPATLPDDLQALEASLGTVVERLDTLGETVSDASLGLASVTDRLGAAAGELQSLDDRVDQWTARLATARETIAAAKARVSAAIDLAAIGLSLLLVLLGAGQVSLGLQGWRWLRAPSVARS
jgi:hypothetical protein